MSAAGEISLQEGRNRGIGGISSCDCLEVGCRTAGREGACNVTRHRIQARGDRDQFYGQHRLILALATSMNQYMSCSAWHWYVTSNHNPGTGESGC